jgi:hypothetical protein
VAREGRRRRSADVRKEKGEARRAGLGWPEAKAQGGVTGWVGRPARGKRPDGLGQAEIQGERKSI